MNLVGLISNDEQIHQKIRKLLLYNRKYSIGIACTSFAEYKIMAEDKKGVDIMIVDCRQDELENLSTVRYLNRHHSLSIAAITGDTNPGNILKMIKAGTIGFLIQPFNGEAFFCCLQNITENKSFLDEGLLLKVFSIMHTEEDNNPGMLLSEREFEIIKLISKGCRNKEIGEQLHISHHTVNQHLKKIYRKFEVNSRGRLIHKLMEINQAK